MTTQWQAAPGKDNPYVTEEHPPPNVSRDYMRARLDTLPSSKPPGKLSSLVGMNTEEIMLGKKRQADIWPPESDQGNKTLTCD